MRYFTLFSALLVSSVTWAGGAPTSRFAVDVTLGQATQDSTLNTAALTQQGYTTITSSQTEKRSSPRLSLRYYLHPRWSAELGFTSLGKHHFTLNTTLPAGKTAAQAAVDISNITPRRGSDTSYLFGANYHHPLTSRLQLQVGAGMAAWQDDHRITINGENFDTRHHGTDPYWRLGLGWAVKPNIAVVGHVERYFLTEPVDRVELGVAYRF